jgi:hypothetical protein
MEFAGCATQRSMTRTYPLSADMPPTDASSNTKMAHWRDLKIEYYRDGQVIYMEFGRIFATPEGDGRILVLSPDKKQIETRSYGFEQAVLDTEDQQAMNTLLAPVLIKGWELDTVLAQDPGTLLAKAYPATLESFEVELDMDEELIEFLIELFALFLETVVH